MSHIKVKSGSHEWTMHEALCNNLEELKKAQKNDWDFKPLISGDGMTRTGKSTIAFQTAQFIDPTFSDEWQKRIIFEGEKLIKTAYEIGTQKVLVYDEAREGLDNKKQMERYTKNILDFFSQCGNLNHMIIIVLPDYFELPKTIAITQSIFLINCYTKNGFQRGYFDFFNRKDKRFLYIKGTKYLDYTSQRPSFKGTFTKYSIVPRKQYEKLKTQTMHKIRQRENVTEIKERAETHKIRVRILIKYMMRILKIKPAFISELLGIARTTIYEYTKEDKK